MLCNSCAASEKNLAPSQNNALNNISKSNASTKKEGAMQHTLDSWLHEDWEPTLSKNKKIQKKYMHKDRNFTLQEYVNKASAYMKAKPNNYNNSNVHKLESMPVIGK
ncbi:hypothetical protein MNB_SM-6-1527 [hydrothermal vent metagenome]|uniref:Uncharacterized protein n=1 Tax=hydrothermal vent metagenome TaxID=652676 RepID=A0A1W1BNQ1_9ZZZZ